VAPTFPYLGFVVDVTLKTPLLLVYSADTF